jgi:hypothetical protein
VDPDYRSFASRARQAYQITQSRSTVFRARGGIYHAIDNAKELQFEIGGTPFYSSQTLDLSPNTPTPLGNPTQGQNPREQ